MSTLRVYAIGRQLVRAVQVLLPRIAARSRNLADQVDRSSQSVPAHWSGIRRTGADVSPRRRRIPRESTSATKSRGVNIAEAEHRHDGNGRQRLMSAYGSARETKTHLEMAVDIGCMRECEAAKAIDLADHAAAGLYRLLHKRRA
jgi:four helix bundle protein